MPRYFSLLDPARQMTKLINQEGESCPVEMVIREGVFNAIDSCVRHKHNNPDYDGPSEVIVSKNKDNKLTITNIGGDYFSEECAEKYFITLANTCEENSKVNLNYDQNKGRGAKLYLPHAPQGILYKSRKNREEAISFHVKLQDDGYYGLSDFYCPEIESKTVFPYCSTFSPALTGNIGTDMILMGATAEQDSWAELCSRASAHREKETQSGWSLVHYISNRLWGPPPVPIKVDIHHANKSDKKTYGTRHYSHKCLDLKSQMQKRKIYKSFELPEFEGVIPGTKVHCAFLDSSDVGYYTTTSGFVGFAYKGEVYYNKNAHLNSRRHELMNCGIFTNSTKWLIVFEFPSDVNLSSSGDRTLIKGIDKNMYYNCLKENLPEEIKTWLNNQIADTVDPTDLRKWLKKELSCFTFPFEMSGDHGALSGNSKLSSGKTKKFKSQKTTGKIRLKDSLKKLKTFEIPEIISLEDDESELIRFSFEEYRIFYNSSHPVAKHRAAHFIRKHTKIMPAEIDLKVLEFTIKSALYRIYEIQQLYSDESIQFKKDKWNASILEALWSADINSKISNTLSKRENHRSAA